MVDECTADLPNAAAKRRATAAEERSARLGEMGDRVWSNGDVLLSDWRWDFVSGV